MAKMFRMAAQGLDLQASMSPYPGQALNPNVSASDAVNNNNAASMNNNNAASMNNNNNPDDNDENDARAVGPGGAQGQLGEDPANVPANNNNAAGQNGVDDLLGAPLNRDWLDIFDMLSRLVVLTSIVYFYSSPSRLMIVTFLGFAIYL